LILKLINLDNKANLIENYASLSIPVTTSKKSNQLPPKNPCWERVRVRAKMSSYQINN
jgi:hypothetical protein